MSTSTGSTALTTGKLSVNQKGIIPLLVVLLVAVAIGITGYLVFQTQVKVTSKRTQIIQSSPGPSSTLTPIPKPTLSSYATPTATALPTIIPTPSPTNAIKTQVKVIGDKTCVDQTNQALNLLQYKALDDYDNVVSYIGIIECTEAGSGMYAWEDPPRYKAGKVTRDAGTIWYAGTIVHDAWHSQLYHDYLVDHPASSVPDNIWTGKDAEQKCLEVQYSALQKIGADQTTLDYVKNVINTDYWNDNNRYW